MLNLTSDAEELNWKKENLIKFNLKLQLFVFASLKNGVSFEITGKRQDCCVNWAKCRPPEPPQEVWEQQRSRGTGSAQCVGVSPEGRKREGQGMGKERRKGGVRRLMQRERKRESAGQRGCEGSQFLCIVWNVIESWSRSNSWEVPPLLVSSC